MEQKIISKEYHKIGEINHSLEASKCIHSGICVKKPYRQVYDPNKVNPRISRKCFTRQNLKSKVSKCPYAALKKNFSFFFYFCMNHKKLKRI